MATKKRRVAKATTTEQDNLYLNAAFNEFIAEKEALGLTKDTINAYKATFDKFYDYFVDKADYAGDITSSMFIEWTNAMRDEGLAIASINHHLGGIRPFMRWCMEDIRKYLPFFTIRLVKRQEEPPKDYTLDEVELLINKPHKDSKFTDWRTWAIVNFILGTGARVGTIVEILIKDVDLDKGVVFYRHTKNKKLQYNNIPPHLVRILRDFKNDYRTQDIEHKDISPDDYFFCNVSGEQMSKDALKASYSKFAKSRGVNKTSLHGLRHTFAREWYLNGGDVVQLSKVLGHSTLKMSEHYMNVYSHHAKDRFVQCNPLENIARARSNARKTVAKRD